MRLAPIALLAGGGVLTGLVAWYGAAAIGREVLSAAWTLPLIMAVHGVQQWFSAVAWRWVVGGAEPGLGQYFLVRVIREAVNGLLPVAQLGGNVVGVRMLMHRGVGGTGATAGTTIDVTIEAVTQLVFTLAGIAVLAGISSDRAWLPWVQGGVAAMAVGVVGFILLQRHVGPRVIDWLAGPLLRLFPRLPLAAAHNLFAALRARQRQPGLLLRAAALHMAVLVMGVAETWLVLAATGRPVGLAEAVVVESLGMAVRGAGFAVPGGLGVQEAGFIIVGGLVGVPPDQAIALSMVKRLRELAFGLPALVTWQLGEGRRLLRRG